MLRTSLFVAGFSTISLLAGAAQAVTFTLVKQLDGAALNFGSPGSIAAYGNDVYVGTLFGGAQLHHIANPLGAAANINTFGGINNSLTNGGLASAGPTSNGYVSLHTNGVTLVAATDNGGATPDIAQSYAFGTDTLKWGNNAGPTFAGGLNTQGNRIDGAGIEPVTGRVMLTAFGGDRQNFFDANTGAEVVVPGANILFYPGVGTGWKDVSYDNATGDLYLRAWGGVARGQRIGDGQFQTLEGGAGVQTIVNTDDNFVSAVNSEFIPTSAAGVPLVIANYRSLGGSTFADKVKVFLATPPSAGGTATETPVSANFVGLDGITPFTTAAAGSGIYDFSFDPVAGLLYVSDFSAGQVHVFAVPEPGTMMLGLGLAGCAMLRRRAR